MSEQAGPDWPAGTRILRVGDVVVDLGCRELERDAGTVELQQRVFDLLVVMLREPYVLHTRAALFERVWPGVVVEDASLSQAVWLLRRALGDERRHWIRTIPKRGYLFEPPAAPFPVEGAIPATTVGPEPEPEPEPERSADPERPELARRWAAGAVLAGVLASALATLVMLPLRTGQVLLDEPPVAVALLQVEAEDADGRWPALLLQSWLEWKLSTLPEVEVIDAGWLAADAAVARPHVVLLSSGVASVDRDQHYVRARLDTRDGPRQLEARGSEAEVPQLVDALSRQVLALLLPGRATEPWPSLAANPPVARDYVAAWEASREGDPASAAGALDRVLAQAPDFGLAELQLALARARLGESDAAAGHIGRARRLLRPLGMDSERVMAVRELSLDPLRAGEAAEAFGALAREHPDRISLRLDHAAELIESGRPDDAEASLQAVEWARQPLAQRLRWRMVMAGLAAARRDTEGVREHARGAERLARRIGGRPEQVEIARLLASAGVSGPGAEAHGLPWESCRGVAPARLGP